MVKIGKSFKPLECLMSFDRNAFGAIVITISDLHHRMSRPVDPSYENDLMVASHYWSAIKATWIEIDKDIEFPTFMSMRAQNRFRCSEAAPFLWAVLLNGKPCTKWETADSQRGYVDLWHREATSQRTVRNRLFGRVKFIKIQ